MILNKISRTIRSKVTEALIVDHLEVESRWLNFTVALMQLTYNLIQSYFF